MKRLVIFSAMLAFTQLSIIAQDDLYFFPEKSKEQKTEVKVENKTKAREPELIFKGNADVEVYNTSSRDEDEYNRRYMYSGDDVEPDTIEAVESNIYDDENDYQYSRQILRFYSPHVGVYVSSPYYWDLVYGYGAFDYIYADPLFYYDPYYWSWGWSFGWGWRPWGSWYGPFWGWYHPHHWVGWGCGPCWHNPHPVRYNANRGTFVNGYGRGSRIRTGDMVQTSRTNAFNRTNALNRTNVYDRTNSTYNRGGYTSGSRVTNTSGNGQTTTTRRRTYTRGQSTGTNTNSQNRTRQTSSFNRSSSQSTRNSSTYSRPSSTRSSGSFSSPSRSGGFGGGGFGGGSRGGGGVRSGRR